MPFARHVHRANPGPLPPKDARASLVTRPHVTEYSVILMTTGHAIQFTRRNAHDEWFESVNFQRKFASGSHYMNEAIALDLRENTESKWRITPLGMLFII